MAKKSPSIAKKQPSPSPPSSFSSLSSISKSFVIAVVALAIGLYFYQPFLISFYPYPPSHITGPLDNPLRFVKKVERISWPKEKGSFTVPISELNKPIILTDTFMATEWPAAKKWKSLSYLSDLLPPSLPGVYVNQDRVFIHYNPEAPMKADFTPTAERINLKKDTFFKNIVQDHSWISPLASKDKSATEGDNKFYYFNTMVEDLSSEQLTNDASPFEGLGVPENITNTAEAEVKMWVSSQGVVANIHYDATHNFYLQVKGRKRVILAPPSQWVNLYMYPQPHPSDRQSQVNFTVLTTSALGMNTSSECQKLLQKYPKIKNLKGNLWEAILEEGDVLFIPAFHFHHFESLDPATVSVNVWSNSVDYVAFSEFIKNALPFTNDPFVEWKTNIILFVMEYFVPGLIRTTLPGVDPNQFLRDLILDEYGPLGFEVEETGRPKKCPSSIVPDTISSLSSSSSSSSPEGLALVIQKAWPGLALDNSFPIDDYLDPYYHLLSTKVFSHMNPDVRRIMLASWLEGVLSQLISWQETPFFISMCLVK